TRAGSRSPCSARAGRAPGRTSGRNGGARSVGSRRKMAIPAANIDHTLFFTLGIALIVSALVVSAIGLRFESFPPNRLVLTAVIASFVALVAGTTTFAVLNACDEQHKNEAEQAAAT